MSRHNRSFFGNVGFWWDSDLFSFKSIQEKRVSQGSFAKPDERVKYSIPFVKKSGFKITSASLLLLQNNGTERCLHHLSPQRHPKSCKSGGTILHYLPAKSSRYSVEVVLCHVTPVYPRAHKIKCLFVIMWRLIWIIQRVRYELLYEILTISIYPIDNILFVYGQKSLIISWKDL